MKKEVIATKNAPSAMGAYSQGIKTGSFVFTSGQIPVDPVTGILVTDDIRKATAQSLENVKGVLEEAGSCLDNVIKTTVFLKDMSDFNDVNEVYSTYFTNNPPARSCIQVAELPKGALIEIEAVAVSEA